MPLAHEDPPAGEEQTIGALLDAILGRKIQRVRDAHAKSTGLVKAVFKIEEDLSQNLRIGVFADAGREYCSLIRFSNATQATDDEPDSRGIAIKLVGVEGEKEPLDQEDDGQTQDFLLTSSREFLGGSVAEFAQIAAKKATQPNPADFVAFLGQLNPRLPGILQSMLDMSGNPLAIDYHSTTPYLFAEGNAVKYRVRRAAGGGTLPRNHADLKQALADSLVDQEQILDFFVQLQKEGMSIEDATAPWKPAESEFHKVATITIPKQNVNHGDRN